MIKQIKNSQITGTLKTEKASVGWVLAPTN